MSTTPSSSDRLAFAAGAATLFMRATIAGPGGAPIPRTKAG